MKTQIIFVIAVLITTVSSGCNKTPYNKADLDGWKSLVDHVFPKLINSDDQSKVICGDEKSYEDPCCYCNKSHSRYQYVHCDNRKHKKYISKIVMKKNGLKGNLPVSLGWLSQLNVLDFRGNPELKGEDGGCIDAGVLCDDLDVCHICDKKDCDKMLCKSKKEEEYEEYEEEDDDDEVEEQKGSKTTDEMEQKPVKEDDKATKTDSDKTEENNESSPESKQDSEKENSKDDISKKEKEDEESEYEYEEEAIDKELVKEEKEIEKEIVEEEYEYEEEVIEKEILNEEESKQKSPTNPPVIQKELNAKPEVNLDNTINNKIPSKDKSKNSAINSGWIIASGLLIFAAAILLVISRSTRSYFSADTEDKGDHDNDFDEEREKILDANGEEYKPIIV